MLALFRALNDSQPFSDGGNNSDVGNWCRRMKTGTNNGLRAADPRLDEIDGRPLGTMGTGYV